MGNNSSNKKSTSKSSKNSTKKSTGSKSTSRSSKSNSSNSKKSFSSAKKSSGSSSKNNSKNSTPSTKGSSNKGTKKNSPKKSTSKTSNGGSNSSNNDGDGRKGQKTNSIIRKPSSQKEAVLMSLQKRGSINTIEAFEKYKISRLSAFIYELREDGFRIITERKTTARTKYGYRRAYVEYSFASLKKNNRVNNNSNRFTAEYKPVQNKATSVETTTLA